MQDSTESKIHHFYLIKKNNYFKILSLQIEKLYFKIV